MSVPENFTTHVLYLLQFSLLNCRTLIDSVIGGSASILVAHKPLTFLCNEVKAYLHFRFGYVNQ